MVGTSDHRGVQATVWTDATSHLNLDEVVTGADCGLLLTQW